MQEIRMAILGINDDVLAFMDNTSETTLHYYSDELTEYLKGSAATFNFKSPATHEDSVNLVTGNKISFRADDKDYYFNIMHTERDEKEVSVECYSLSFELLNEIREKYKASKAMSFVEYMGAIDHEHVITIGINEVADKRITHEWEGEDTILSRIFSLANVFSAEVEFVSELNDDYSLKRIVMNVYREHSDTNQGIGKSEGVVIRYGKEISGITKTSDVTELYTAIRPKGRGGLTIAYIEKEENDKNGNIEYKSPMNNPYIYAVQARNNFPSNLLSGESERYILRYFEYDTDNVNTLYGQALARLKKDCVPKVEYQVDGYFDTGIGDTVTIVDEEYTPELYLSARVTEQKRSFTDPSQSKTTFDNFNELQSQVDNSLLGRVEELIKQNKTYTTMISTDNGIVFKNGIGSTTMTAHVRDSGGVELASNYTIHWYKNGEEVYIGNPYTLNSSDVDEKAVVRFEATDAGGNVKAFFEVTVSDVSDGKDGGPGKDGVGIAATTVMYQLGSSGTLAPTGDWKNSPMEQTDAQPFLWVRTVIEYTDKQTKTLYSVSKKGDSGAPGKDGEPTGITVSATEPTKKFIGMLWKHTGTVAGFVKDATYRWTGSKWELYLFVAKNIQVGSLSALSADLGKITAGSIDVPWIDKWEEGESVSGVTKLTDASGGGNPLFMEYTVRGARGVVGTGYTKYGYNGVEIDYTDSVTGIKRQTLLSLSGIIINQNGSSRIFTWEDIGNLSKKTYKLTATPWSNPAYTLELINKVVYIGYHAIVASLQGMKEYHIATLPAELKPKVEKRCSAWCADGKGERIACSLTIKTDGTIRFVAAKAFAEAGFVVSYPL